MDNRELSKINKKLDRKFQGKVRAEYNGEFTRVTGELESWDDIVEACSMAVSKDKTNHVVNDVNWTGGTRNKMRIPTNKDNILDGQKPDILVIGGGISGASILRELARWDIDALLIDKESDLAMHASSHNDGEVHPGVDLAKGTLKQKYIVKSNRMYDKVCEDLSVPFKRCGQHVCFTQWWTRPIMRLYAYQRKHSCGVDDTRIVGRKELFREFPNISRNAKFSLYNSMAGCVSPYELTIAYGENAVENGARVMLDTAAISMEVVDGRIVSVKTNRGTLFPRVVINAAGVFSEEVARMAEDRFFSIHPRRGTDAILDKKVSGLTTCVVTVKEAGEGKEKHTKGGGVIPTAHGNLLVGPDAVETPERETFPTNAGSLDSIFEKQQKALPTLSKSDVINYFSGIRAATFEEDFIIERGRKTKNLVHCAGIQSPGLTTAPAVAVDVAELAVNILKEETQVGRNGGFNPVRKAKPVMNNFSPGEREEWIKKNPDYGKIICRCEEISKGEIIDAISSPVPVYTIDGVKRRVRPGSGRCQGGFCMPLVAKIISEYDNCEISQVRKAGENSVISYGRLK